MARNQTIRTANEIINSVLTRVGNLALSDEAEAELNNIMARLYEDYKWPFLTTTVSGTISSGSTNVDLPDDFTDMTSRYSIRLVDSDGNIITSHIISDPDFEYFVATPQGSTPMGIHIDFRNNTFRSVPYLDNDIDYVLTYQMNFDPITDYDLPINFPNDQLITQLLFVWALQHEDDDRYTTEIQVADKMLAKYIARFSTSPLRQSRLAMNRSTFIPMFNRR
jgi:hypothetical protein